MSAVESPTSSTAADWITWAEARIGPVSEASRLEAELLLAESAGIGRSSVMAHPERRLSAGQASRFEAAVERRSSGEPMAYIVGSREFYSLPLSVGPDVLVPRPETETLVETALERLRRPAARVLDLGTGSGAIALALKHARPDLEITAVDCDEAALEVARANAARLDLGIRWLRSDWFSAVAGQRFDAVVSNPPYVASEDPHFDSALAFEPRLALDGGADGLDPCREILRRAGGCLVSSGWLLLEHGFDQRAALVGLAAASGFELEAAVDDLAGLPRVVCFRRVGP